MADEVRPEKSEAAARAVVPMVPLLLSVVAAVVMAVAVLGAAGWWMFRSGRLPVVQGATHVETIKEQPAKTKLVPLEPLLVNLVDSGGRSYLRVAMTLRVLDVESAKVQPEKTKPVNENEAALRDAALDILGKQTAADLLAPDGKARLKVELRGEMERRVPEAKVMDVLFTEFLVQQ